MVVIVILVFCKCSRTAGVVLVGVLINFNDILFKVQNE